MKLVERIKNMPAEAKSAAQAAGLGFLADGMFTFVAYQAATRGDDLAALAYASAALGITHLSGRLAKKAYDAYKQKTI